MINSIRKNVHIRSSVVGLNVSYIVGIVFILFFAAMMAGTELYVSSLNAAPGYYKMDSAFGNVLFYKQVMCMLNVTRYFLAVFWILMNIVIYIRIKKKSPEIAEPVKTLFPFKAVNTVLCVLNIIASAAVGVLLTIKENAYAYSELNAGQILSYLEELNLIAVQIWWLLILEFVITSALIFFGKLSAKQALQRLSLCTVSFLPFIICTTPFFM